MTTTFEESFEKLTKLTNWEVKKPGSRHRIDLSGTIDLLDRLGNPQTRLKSVAQVAGSKGKGSTVALLAGMGRALGLRTAAYMSPHVVDPRERILVDGAPVDDAVFADAVARVEAALVPEQTWYEAYTAVAILCAEAIAVELLVLEVGLGGRLDATTVVPKDVCAITTIELEHTHVLGDTVEAIAAEKAGILRPEVPCVTACTGAALEVVEQRAAACGAPLRVHARDFAARLVARTANTITLEHEARDRAAATLLVEVPLRASYQIPSFALALEMLEAMQPGAAARLFEGRETGELAWLGRALPPGRFDVVQDDPPIIVDGAHTDASLGALAAELEAAWPGRRFSLIFGIAQGKRYLKGLGKLLRLVDSATVLSLRGKASVAPSDLAEICRDHGVAVDVAPDVEAALSRVLPVERQGGLCIAGSLYAAGDALRILRSPGSG